jgi:hypothetical protein
MDVKRVAPWDRRGMKFPGYKTAPVETGWRVAAATSPVDGAPFCSRAIYRPAVAAVETSGMDATRVLPRSIARRSPQAERDGAEKPEALSASGLE